MRKLATFAVLAVVALALAACARSVQGMEQDAADTTEAVLTPKIKAAIIANPLLNEPANMIDVETENGTVHLKGYVESQAAKEEAQQIAQRVLDESQSDFKLSNELEVRPPGTVEDGASPPPSSSSG